MHGGKWWIRKLTKIHLHTFKKINFQFLNGKLVDESILLMAETLSTNSQQLQDNMVAVSTCGSKSNNNVFRIKKKAHFTAKSNVNFAQQNDFLYF